MTRAALRWALVFIAHPDFLWRLWRQVVDKQTDYEPWTSTFDVMPDTAVGPLREGVDCLAGRREARAWIAGAIGSDQEPQHQLRQLILALRTGPLEDKDQELFRFNADPLVFGRTLTPAEATCAELHAHFRGSIPFPELWKQWMKGHFNDLHRLKLRARSAQWLDRRGDPLGWRQIVEWVSDHAPKAVVDPLPSATDLEGWLALAIRNAVRCALLYERQHGGLERFTDLYDRYSKSQRRGRIASVAFYEGIYDQMALDGVCHIEIRPTFDDRPRDLLGKLHAAVRGWFEHRQSKVAPKAERLALVLSLFKQQDVKNKTDAFETWRDQAESWTRQVDLLLDLLVDQPWLRFFVAGIDAAGGERGCPPRVFGEAFARIARFNTRFNNDHALFGPRPPLEPLEGEDYDHWLDRLIAERPPMPRLGRTIHAGEDFVDPLTGLRHVWEAVELLDLQPGERLGHALATGLIDLERPACDRATLETTLKRRVDAQALFASKDGWLARKPRGAHLLDLGWAAHVAPRLPRECLRRATLAWAREGLVDASKRMFGAPFDPAWLAGELMATGAAPRIHLRSLRFARSTEVALEDVELVRLDKPWRAAFEVLRAWTLKLIRDRGIVIESCPTSNVAVANLEHPVTPTFIDALADRDQVVVCTDDPAIFGSWMPDELKRFPNQRERLAQASLRRAFVRR